MPAAAKKAKAPSRADLCKELLELRSANAAAFDRIEAIKTELKTIAGTEGKFRETFVGLGYVSVSPEAGPKFKGDFPVVDVEAYKALTPARQAKLLEGGVVKIESQYSGAYYGAVTVKLHGAEA